MDGVKLGSSAPSPAIIGNYSVLQFNGTTANVDEAYTSFHVPEDWQDETDIKVHIHWAPTNTGGGNVVWQITYSATASNVGELITAAGITLSTTDASGGTTDALLESPDMTISGANIEHEDMLGIRLFRDSTDPDDSYTADASAVWIEFEYQSNKLGI
jgi:hypothetical protein